MRAYRPNEAGDKQYCDNRQAGTADQGRIGSNSSAKLAFFYVWYYITAYLVK
jgi:hypothetical protein